MLSFSVLGRRIASTNEAQTLPLTATVRRSSAWPRCMNRVVVVRTEKRPRVERMARFRFARGNDAQNNARGRFPRKNAGRKPEKKVAKANDADDQPVDCQTAQAAADPQHGAGAAVLAAKARRLHPRLYD